MPAVQSRLRSEAIRSVAIGDAYANLGTAFANPIRFFKIVNDTTGGILISYDGGTTDHEFLPANSFLLVDITSNKVWDCQFCLAEATQVSVKRNVPATGAGTVYLSTYYAS